MIPASMAAGTTPAPSSMGTTPVACSAPPTPACRRRGSGATSRSATSSPAARGLRSFAEYRGDVQHRGRREADLFPVPLVPSVLNVSRLTAVRTGGRRSAISSAAEGPLPLRALVERQGDHLRRAG